MQTPLFFAGSLSHSLCYFNLQVQEPSQGLPQILSMLHLDDQPIACYESLTRRTVPLVPWMQEVEKEDPNDRKEWDEPLLAPEQVFGDELKRVQKLYQQNGGFFVFPSSSL